MALTFMEMVGAAQAQVQGISVDEAAAALADGSNPLVIDVRDRADIASTGIMPGALAVSLGTLSFKADSTLDPAFQHPEIVADKDRPILVTCQIGAMAALGAKQLDDMGYTNVRYVQGGTAAWADSGRPIEPID